MPTLRLILTPAVDKTDVCGRNLVLHHLGRFLGVHLRSHLRRECAVFNRVSALERLMGRKWFVAGP